MPGGVKDWGPSRYYSVESVHHWTEKTGTSVKDRGANGAGERDHDLSHASLLHRSGILSAQWMTEEMTEGDNDLLALTRLDLIADFKCYTAGTTIDRTEQSRPCTSRAGRLSNTTNSTIVSRPNAVRCQPANAPESNKHHVRPWTKGRYCRSTQPPFLGLVPTQRRERLVGRRSLVLWPCNHEIA